MLRYICTRQNHPLSLIYKSKIIRAPCTHRARMHTLRTVVLYLTMASITQPIRPGLKVTQLLLSFLRFHSLSLRNILTMIYSSSTHVATYNLIDQSRPIVSYIVCVSLVLSLILESRLQRGRTSGKNLVQIRDIVVVFFSFSPDNDMQLLFQSIIPFTHIYLSITPEYYWQSCVRRSFVELSTTPTTPLNAVLHCIAFLAPTRDTPSPL